MSELTDATVGEVIDRAVFGDNGLIPAIVQEAGSKDVLMLVPVVFLILPTVVLVALFPGIQALRLVVA